jgi:hypothetical protein
VPPSPNLTPWAALSVRQHRPHTTKTETELPFSVFFFVGKYIDDGSFVGFTQMPVPKGFQRRYRAGLFNSISDRRARFENHCHQSSSGLHIAYRCSKRCEACTYHCLRSGLFRHFFGILQIFRQRQIVSLTFFRFFFFFVVQILAKHPQVHFVEQTINFFSFSCHRIEIGNGGFRMDQ